MAVITSILTAPTCTGSALESQITLSSDTVSTSGSSYYYSGSSTYKTNDTIYYVTPYVASTYKKFIRSIDNYITYTTIPITYENNVRITLSDVNAGGFSTYYMPVYSDHGSSNTPLTKQQMIRSKLRRQLVPDFTPTNADLLACNSDPAEQKARGLLRELVGNKEFRTYMRRGFITVRGRSGLFYRIFGGNRHMISFAKHDDGKYYEHEDICVIFTNTGMPMTDAVVMRLLLIENDEFGLRKLANVISIAPQNATSKPVMTLVA